AGVITIFCASALGSARPTIYGDGAQTRDYVYVGDVVAAFLAAADRGRPGTWNIGTGLEVSVLDLVEIIAGIAGRELTPVFAPARRGELARSVLAGEPAAGALGLRGGPPGGGGDPPGRPGDQGRGARPGRPLAPRPPGAGPARWWPGISGRATATRLSACPDPMGAAPTSCARYG